MCLYNWVSWVFQMLICSWYPSFISLFLISVPPVSFAHFLILTSFCVTVVSASPPHLWASLPHYPPICLHSFSSSLVHLCSFSFSLLSVFSPLPSLTRSPLSHLFQRVEMGIAQCQRGEEGGGVPFLHSIHTSSAEDARELCNVWREKICGNICRTDAQPKVIQCHHFTLM